MTTFKPDRQPVGASQRRGMLLMLSAILILLPHRSKRDIFHDQSHITLSDYPKTTTCQSVFDSLSSPLSLNCANPHRFFPPRAAHGELPLQSSGQSMAGSVFKAAVSTVRYTFSLVQSCLPLVSTLTFAEAVSPNELKHKDFYKLLGIPRNASTNQIKSAARTMQKKYHPDRNNDSDTTEMFQNIAYASEVLTDPDKRRVYDQQGVQGLERMRGTDGQEDDGFDIFSSFFGGAGRREREMAKVPDMSLPLFVTLEQLYFGENLGLTFHRPVVCPRAEECYKKRSDCKGAGIRVVTQQMGPGFMVQNQIRDENCVEKGHSWVPNCKACPNGMRSEDSVHLNADIQSGWETGKKITFSGAGEQKLGHESGDVILNITQVKHPVYERDGNNLHMTLEIDLLEALVGFSKEVNHIDKQKVTVSSTRVLHDGAKNVIEKKGMPTRSGSFGDLVITFKIKYPVSLTDIQKSSLRNVLDGITSKAYYD